MSCTISPINYFVEISYPASLAKVLAEPNIFRKIREIVIKILSLGDLMIFNNADERLMFVPNQVKILHGSNTDFSLLVIKPGFVKVS